MMVLDDSYYLSPVINSPSLKNLALELILLEQVITNDTPLEPDTQGFRDL